MHLYRFSGDKIQLFSPVPRPPPPHFNCFSFHRHHISIVFPPPPPPPPHFYCFLSTTTTATTFLLFSLHHYHRHHISIVFSPPDSIKDYQLSFLVHFVAMSRVVNNNRGFLPLLAACPAYQRQFLVKTATPQQLHALVQVLYNVLIWDTFLPPKKISGYCCHKDALLNLASPNVPYKTKNRVLVQEGSGFIEDVLAPVVSSLGFLIL